MGIRPLLLNSDCGKPIWFFQGFAEENGRKCHSPLSPLPHGTISQQPQDTDQLSPLFLQTVFLYLQYQERSEIPSSEPVCVSNTERDKRGSLGLAVLCQAHAQCRMDVEHNSVPQRTDPVRVTWGANSWA